MGESLDKALRDCLTMRVQQRIALYWKKHETMPDVGKIVDEQYEAVYMPVIDHLRALTAAMVAAQEKEESNE